jgi:hypothetical protein
MFFGDLYALNLINVSSLRVMEIGGILYLYNNVVLAMTMSSTLTTVWHSHC